MNVYEINQNFDKGLKKLSIIQGNTEIISAKAICFMWISVTQKFLRQLL